MKKFLQKYVLNFLLLFCLIFQCAAVLQAGSGCFCLTKNQLCASGLTTASDCCSEQSSPSSLEGCCQTGPVCCSEREEQAAAVAAYVSTDCENCSCCISSLPVPQVPAVGTEFVPDFQLSQLPSSIATIPQTSSYHGDSALARLPEAPTQPLLCVWLN